MNNYRFTISKKAEVMSESNCADYITEINNWKKYIHDINVTCKMSPFITDAHGVLMNARDNKEHIRQMLYVQEQTGVPISLVFNNIYVPNDADTLHVFLDNFKEYYDWGIRSITMPHILWMKFGEIQNEYPELYIKSTVLRRVRSGQEFWNYALAGFHCVNVDRLLFRNLKELQTINYAKRKFYEVYGKKVDISMVVGENCIGSCPFWEEHYQYNMTSKMCMQLLTNKKGFNLVREYSDCKDFDKVCLKRVNLVGFREDMDKVFENIDLIKIGGRRFKVDAFKIIGSFVDSHLDCHPLLHRILVRGNQKELELLGKWRENTKNCGYQCWNCNLCDQMDEIIFRSQMREWRHIMK